MYIYNSYKGSNKFGNRTATKLYIADSHNYDKFYSIYLLVIALCPASYIAAIFLTRTSSTIYKKNIEMWYWYNDFTTKTWRVG